MTPVAAVSVRSFQANDLSSSSFLPTIRLSSVPELTNAICLRDSCCNDIPAFAVAEQVPVAMTCDADSDYFHLRRAPRNNAFARAEYVSAHFHNSEKLPLGFKLVKEDKKNASIAEIAPNSLVAKSPLKVGDKILSINQQPCSKMTTDEIYELLETLTDITLIVQTPSGGASDVVESMLTKKHPKESIGITFYRGRISHKFVVSKISGSARAIADSLLNVGDEIISINGVSMDKLNEDTEAKQLIAAASKTVTIKAITQRDTGVVLGEVRTSIKPQQQSTGAPATRRTARRHKVFGCLLRAFTDPSTWT